MEQVKEEKIENEIESPKRVFAKKITIGTLKKADLSMEDLAELDFKSTKGLDILVKLLNALLVEGPPFNDDTDPFELVFYMDDLDSFLEQSRRFEAAKERLKLKRLPRS